MQKKDIYLICVTMIICSIIIGLIVGSFILHGLEDIAALIDHGLMTINQSINSINQSINSINQSINW